MNALAGQLSVVIVTRDRSDDLRELLLSLRRQTRPADEIIVVDNASADGTWEMLRADFAEVKAIRADQNLGCPGGRNVGLKAAAGDIAVCLDDDLVVGDDALALFAASLECDERLGVVFGQVISYEGGVLPKWAYSAGPRPQQRCYTYSFSGGVAALRTQALDEVGYYPDDFVRQGEELDLSYRLLDRGWRILYDPQIVCRHKVSPWGRLPPHIAFYNTRNALWICWRNLPLPAAFAHSLWKVVYYPVTYAGQRLFWASARGVLASVPGLAESVAKRCPVRKGTWCLIRKLKQQPVLSQEELRGLEESCGLRRGAVGRGA